MSGLVDHFRAMALNNAWSNGRLIDACAALSAEEFAAKCVSFFPSLQATLNYILIVDWYYLDALEAGGRGYDVFADLVPFPEIEAMHEAQFETDRRLIRFCDGLSDEDLDSEVLLDRRERGIRHETVATVLPHLFTHQIHHRGQAHAMLSGSEVAPPQLDESFLKEDAHNKASALSRLGLAD